MSVHEDLCGRTLHETYVEQPQERYPVTMGDKTTNQGIPRRTGERGSSVWVRGMESHQVDWEGSPKTLTSGYRWKGPMAWLHCSEGRLRRGSLESTT